MIESRVQQSISRRDVLRTGAAAAAAAILQPVLPAWIGGPALARAQQAAGQDPLQMFRAQMGTVPITSTTLSERLTLLAGPGGNVVVLHGDDGKIAVDSFVQTAWGKLQETLGTLGKGPIKGLIDTHWHFDHTDNNENFRKAGATIIAHENTRTRMTQKHELLGMKFPPSPAAALPTETFKDRHTMQASGEQITLAHIPPAHTDTDIYVRFAKANVLHLGDTFFNGMYPFIDASTGGNINGMIAAADLGLKQADAQTKIVPGHGPLGDRAALTRYRDMLATVRDRVQKLKKEGRSLQDVVAAAPTKEFDPTWGKGLMQPADFIALVFNTL